MDKQQTHMHGFLHGQTAKNTTQNPPKQVKQELRDAEHNTPEDEASSLITKKIRTSFPHKIFLKFPSKYGYHTNVIHFIHAKKIKFR